MDGMLLVTFFFPALVSFNIALSVATFLFTLIVSFAPEISQVVQGLLESNAFTRDYVSVVLSWFGLLHGQVLSANKNVSVFWPILVSGVTVWTVGTTYGIGGAARHGKKGWKFVQPGVGGVRFVIVQIATWITFALSVCMPWTTIKHFGWFSVLGMLPDHSEDPDSHQSLILVGAALGMLANTFCVLGLMSFDPKEKTIMRKESIHKHRRKIDVGKWKWNIFGDSEAWWWLFLILQGTLVVFSWQLAVMLEMSSSVKNKVVEALLLMVVTALLAVPVALTNAVAGKWRHGERNFRLTMPFQGGPIFVLLQGLGWTLFSGSFVITLFKLYSTATASGVKVSISSTSWLGFVSYLCIVASLLVFDPAQVKTSTAEEPSDSDDGESDGEFSTSTRGGPSKRKVHSILGKRQSPSVKGALEYLVQWRPTSSATWMLEEHLRKEDPDAIKNNEKAVRTPRIGIESRSLNSRQQNDNSARGRSISPKLKPLNGNPQSESEDDDESEEESVAEGADEYTDSETEDVWEEMEDDDGNIFYYNEKKKLSRMTLPDHFIQALARQQQMAEAEIR